MATVYDPEGKHSLDLPLSEKQRALLEAGGEVTIVYHTPQLMRGLIGRSSGQLKVKQTDGRCMASDPLAFRAFQALWVAIEGVRKQREMK